MARFAKPVDDFSSEKEDVIEFRQGYQTLYYNFDHALPPQ